MQVSKHMAIIRKRNRPRDVELMPPCDGHQPVLDERLQALPLTSTAAQLRRTDSTVIRYRFTIPAHNAVLQADC